VASAKTKVPAGTAGVFFRPSGTSISLRSANPAEALGYYQSATKNEAGLKRTSDIMWSHQPKPQRAALAQNRIGPKFLNQTMPRAKLKMKSGQILKMDRL
jgi:hypothetical protein